MVRILKIKDYFLYLLLGGKKIEKIDMLYALTALADLLNLELDNIGEFNSSIVFINRSEEFLKVDDFDSFIAEIKSVLLEQEDYEAITELYL